MSQNTSAAHKEKFMHEYDWHYQWGLEMQYQIFSSVWDRVVHVIHYTDKCNPYSQGRRPFHDRDGYAREYRTKSMQQNQFIEWVFMNPGVMFMYRDLIPNEEARALEICFERAENMRSENEELAVKYPETAMAYKGRGFGFASMALFISYEIKKIHDRRK